MPIITVNTGTMNEILYIQAYQIRKTILASGLEMSEWESPGLDGGQQGRDCYSYFTDEEKRLRRQCVTGILFESNKCIFFSCSVTELQFTL